MLTRDRVLTISKLAIPVSVALSTTMVMSLVDLAMVASLGNEATAAVGLSVFGHALLLAFVGGVGPAVQGLVARRRGQGSSEAGALPLNAGLLASLIVGIPLSIIGYAIAPYFFSLVSSDPGVISTGVPFLRFLYVATVAAGMNAAFQGHWTGIEKPNVFMSIVLFMNVLNFCGNYVLISGRFGFPAMGSAGAALSTAVSLHVGVIINMVLSWRRFRKDGFLTAKPDASLLKRIFGLGIPASAQQFFRAAGVVVFYWIVGQVGTAELAALSVQVRVSMVLGILAISLGSASATLVSRTMGEGDPAGASEWGWDTGKLGVIVLTLLALPLVVFPEFFLSIFLTDPRSIEIAVLPWQLMMGMVGLGSLIYIFAYTLVTVGDGKRVALISFGTQWLVFLPAVWIVGPYLHYGLLQISYVQVIYGAVSAGLITMIWAQGRWQKIAM